MKQLATALKDYVDQVYAQIETIPEEEMARKPSPEKWSKNEILGHLIDSATNNHHRFVRGQYGNTPRIVYHQDDWVRLQDYQSLPKDHILRFWKLYNHHLAHIIEHIAPENKNRKCDTGMEKEELHTLEWMAQDYLDHLKHHINQILK